MRGRETKQSSYERQPAGGRRSWCRRMHPAAILTRLQYGYGCCHTHPSYFPAMNSAKSALARDRPSTHSLTPQLVSSRLSTSFPRLASCRLGHLRLVRHTMHGARLAAPFVDVSSLRYATHQRTRPPWERRGRPVRRRLPPIRVKKQIVITLQLGEVIVLALSRMTVRRNDEDERRLSILALQ